MAVGQYYDVVVCMAGAPAWTSNRRVVVSDCPTGTQPQAVQLYIPIESSLETALHPLSEPFDYAVASGIFSAFFSSIILLWFLSHNIGLILKAVRTW